MKRSFLPLLLLLFISCSVEHEVEVNVTNDSDTAIRDIRFNIPNSREKVWFDELLPKESASVTVPVKNAEFDGDYTFEYFNAEGEKTGTTGNFPEEDFTELYLDFVIFNDSVSVKTKHISKAQL